jgi:hypothetical protein
MSSRRMVSRVTCVAQGLRVEASMKVLPRLLSVIKYTMRQTNFTRRPSRQAARKRQSQCSTNFRLRLNTAVVAVSRVEEWKPARHARHVAQHIANRITRSSMLDAACMHSTMLCDQGLLGIECQAEISGGPASWHSLLHFFFCSVHSQHHLEACP